MHTAMMNPTPKGRGILSKELNANLYKQTSLCAGWMKRWRSCPPGQKTVIADYLNVAFLPDASASIWGIQHTNEKLSDKKFTEKYWDKVIGPYDISHEIPNEESDESEGELSDGLDVVSNQEQSEDKEYEEASEEGEINPGLEQDTEMAQDIKCYTVPHENDWAGR
ncbi:hypothetical protein O181_036217 [Austropuccinia psidii MF-1]|uniref:Uncharacterized protein n=1 Tax=Austropuccinia psidii MF-1 TaxID=1389203 RepID=A0A9Q3DA93_9BASI|nr:hypothetical protein [Austropuccinia psidii MF-1]